MVAGPSSCSNVRRAAPVSPLSTSTEIATPLRKSWVRACQWWPNVATGGANAYREAIELLDKIRVLLGRLGHEEDFAPFRAEVRATHRQRRGFLRLLDAER